MAETTPETPAAETPEGGGKKKKINSLTLAEIEARLAACDEKQGGRHSKYALRLLDRKKALTSKG